jgi:hypothetical protein
LKIASYGHVKIKQINSTNIEWATCLPKKIWQLFSGKLIGLPNQARTYFWHAQPPENTREPNRMLECNADT